MNKPVFFFLMLALLLSGCYKVNKDVVKKPANLIPKDKMADILTDMEIVEGIAVYNKTHFPGSSESVKKAYYTDLFHRYHVTKEQVTASLNYYNSKGDEMAGIYEKVLEKLGQKQMEVNMEQQLAEEKKFPSFVKGWDFPYLYKENRLSNRCYNPLP